MATNLELDDKLTIEALKAGHHKTKEEAVTVALKEYIAHKKQQSIKEFFGVVNFEDSYNYKSARKKGFYHRAHKTGGSFGSA